MEILPAIDLKDGRCVRLLKGDFNTVHEVAEDIEAVASSYAVCPFIHVVDLDGARDGKGKNASIVKKITEACCGESSVELGGGLRCMEDLKKASDLGVTRFILGSAALEDIDFVKEAVKVYGEGIAVSIDAKDGMVYGRGWEKNAGKDYLEFLDEMSACGVKNIIFTDIDTDGTLAGPPIEKLLILRKAFTGNLIASGGIGTLEDVKAVRQTGADGLIIGKALYSGGVTLEDAVFEGRWGKFFDKEKLLPAIIQHAVSNEVLMLGYMNWESLKLTLERKKATFWSRSRNKLWLKGETSGNYLNVLEILGDCDDDTLLLRCIPDGPTCHTGRNSCFGNLKL